MSSFQEVPSSASTLQTSNFAHVIFQNVAKSYLPNTHLECHYTLTQFIHPHQKDWVGIFKVGWSTARDYYTFLWSPMPENYVEGSTVNCVLTFQGYYLPNDDGEFYQFCYVTYKGEIRGASTPFQFRTSSPVEELLTMEDEGNSDMLVVTTKAGLLEFKIEKIIKEKEELLKVTSVLEKETTQLRDQVEQLEKELNHEKQRCEQLQTEQKDNIQTSEAFKRENNDLKKKHEEAASKVLQLEEDIMTVTQKAIAKETELDSLKDKLKKVMLEKEQLECVLKTEKDEKELYKIHLKNTEIENTKLVKEIQTFKNLDANKESMISYYKEEVGRLQLLIAEKENMKKAFLHSSSNKDEASILKEQLRKAEDQIQASKQEAVLMSKELSDAVNVRDKTMADLHSARLENEKFKKQLAEALAELIKITTLKNEQEASNAVEQELRREVEDLKLRLQMAADHYKEKFKECQKLQKQVNKFTEQADEKMKCSVYADELAKLELKWKEQVKINEGIKLQLAAMEDQYKIQLAEKERRIKDLASQLELLTSEKELGRTPGDQAGRMMEGQTSQQTLHFRNPYSEENGPVPAVPSRLPVLQYGNPYAIQERRDGADGAFNPDEIQRPPVRSSFWELEDNVVCSQPSRNLSRPDGLEDPEDGNDDDNTVPSAPDPPSLLLRERGTGFCFDSSFDVHKKCPLCDVVFPPNYDQSKFEEHVESHWKVCPMCSEQFPPDYDQQGFERHVQTHFDQNVLNFD
ncbi:tax1-binding protein 1 isoform X3 [Corvus cornix cornix]|uniref:tax1-binding protein 1 isoform X3 n=1 Tax=Corvus brachyrhynchos TaxID=85066 RepID=UPI0004DE196A|nr:PREDICTED: tax1-binding protein 1 isoform X3 [Corvus brachyrhynchos]XP_039404935.1 tax1-binding protein 1 isoform X3 [Corvus cornix cornix]XP_041898768.1 tax1-binding protein 1 isoform X4 [Corvus kubaryi]